VVVVVPVVVGPVELVLVVVVPGVPDDVRAWTATTPSVVASAVANTTISTTVVVLAAIPLTTILVRLRDLVPLLSWPEASGWSGAPGLFDVTVMPEKFLRARNHLIGRRTASDSLRSESTESMPNAILSLAANNA
jgi:hypothetical protein